MDTNYEFSPLDEIIPPLYFAYILAFESRSDNVDNDHLSLILETGLAKLMDYYPFLSGDVTRDESNTKRRGHLRLNMSPHEKIPYIKQDLTQPGSEWAGSYEELKQSGMASSKLDARILAPLAAGVGTTSKVMSAQLNLIPGGQILSVCFSHAFVDANGASLIIGTWANICRALQYELPIDIFGRASEHTDNPIVIQARNLKADYEVLKQRSELWKLLGLDWRVRRKVQPGIAVQIPLMIPAAAPSPKLSTVESRIFSFSKTSLQVLKQLATSTAVSNAEQSWISTNDALVAFLWQHIMRARFSSNGAEFEFLGERSMVTVAVNGRRTLSIPQTHIGNVIFCSISSLPMDTVVGSQTTLAQLAQTIRMNININNKASILTDALALASCIPADVIQSLRYGFPDFVGKDLVTTSWVDLRFYDMDWGQAFGSSGYIDFFRMPKGQFDGICCLQPRRRDGSIEVVLGLEGWQLERLLADKEFTEIVKIVA